MKNKILTYWIYIGLVITSFPTLTEANVIEGGENMTIQIQNPLGGVETVDDLVGVILAAVVQVGVVVVALGIIFSGFLFVKAQGKPEELKKAKDAFVWTIVGAAIVLGAFVILEIIQATISSLQ